MSYRTTLLCLLLVCTSVDAQAVDAEPGTRVAEIIFDREPIERGMAFDRKLAKPTTVTLKGKKYDAWVSNKSATKNMGWMRSWLFDITDPLLKGGKRPVVDVEIVYHLPAWAGVQVHADTARGAAKVGEGWGDTSDWRTMRVRLDDAFFDQRKHEGAGQFDVSGHDLRLDGANSGFFLRSIRVISYDPTENVHWSRMLKVEAVRPVNHHDDVVFCFQRRADNAITLDAVNLSGRERPLHWTVRVATYDGQKRFDTNGQVNVAAGGRETMRIPLDTSSYPLGPYEARLEMRLKPDDDQAIVTRTIRLGVISDGASELPKAGNGEFLFGLDAGNNHAVDITHPAAGAFYALMGVDLLRNLPLRGAPDGKEKVVRAIEYLRAHQLRSAMIVDPPKPKERDKAWQEKETHRRAELLAWAVREFGGRGIGQIRSVELGNEPDLPFFWPGEIDLYVERMTIMARAIQDAKREANIAPDDVLVVNGGLSFAGPEGDKRSREFLQKVDASVLDAIAYHGHGPGLAAERKAHQRLLAAMRDAGIDNKPTLETESGFSGKSAAGMIEQARTVVGKFTYAHAVGMPSLYYFRLFMEGSGEYGMTDHRAEPRPSVMAYRAMVERLRGASFVKALDTSRVAPGVIAHLYRRDQQWVLLAFSERPARRQLSVRLDVPGQPTIATTFDLFGNAVPSQVMVGNVANVGVDMDPVYVTWHGGGDANVIDLVEPLLAVDDSPTLTGAISQKQVTVRNPSNAPFEGTLKLDATARVKLRVEPTQTPIKLGAGESKQISVTLETDDAQMPLEMPRRWRLFAGVDPQKLDESDWANMPQAMHAPAGKPVAGMDVTSADGKLDFARLIGGTGERRPVVGFAQLDSPSDRTLPVAASADWWMAWYVNGKRVYSTLDKGNQHGSIADHRFELPLRAGRNVIAFECLSGSGGWSIQMAGPRQRALAESLGTPADRLTLALVDANGRLLAEHVAPLELQGPVPTIDASDPSSQAAMRMLDPLAVLGESSLTNRFAAEPDQSRWYKGPSDLSAVVWIAQAKDGVHVQVEVTDADHEPGDPPAEHDSVRLTIADRGGAVLVDRLVSASEAGAIVERRPLDPQTGVTTYQFVLPRSAVAQETFRVSLRVHDRDGGVLKQHLDVGNVDAPASGVLQHFE